MGEREKKSVGRFGSAAQGLVAGWAVATLEALLVWAIEGSRIDAASERVLIPLLPFAVYGTLGALAGAIVRPASWLRAAAVIVFGAWLVRAHASATLGDRMTHVVIAVGLGVLVYVLLVVRARRWARALFAVQALALLATAGALVATGRADETAEPISVTLSDHTASGRASVCFITWDTVRADTLPCFGGGGLDTPQLDRLVSEGVLFERFQSVAPYTGPAHESMLSGLYPIQHGLRGNGDPAPRIASPRLPEICAAAGYATGGFVSTYVLRRAYGFERGFEQFDDRGVATRSEQMLTELGFGCALIRRFVPDGFDLRALNAPGDVTVARAADWYARQSAPVFLWAHFYDAHHPYQPDATSRARVLARAAEGPHAVDPRAEAKLVLQRGEIEELDQRLGELRAELEKRDPGLANTWIVLLADHGECFGEGGIVCAHHGSLYRATQHVPLVIRPPSSVTDWPRGARIATPGSQVDLLPTLCDALGLPIPSGIAGRSLVPAILGRPLAPQGFYMEAFQEELGTERLQGWWDPSGAKYVRRVDGNERLLVEDGAGERDITKEDPARVAAMRGELDRFLETVRAPQSSPVARSARDQRALKQLGYAGEE